MRSPCGCAPPRHLFDVPRRQNGIGPSQDDAVAVEQRDPEVPRASRDALRRFGRRAVTRLVDAAGARRHDDELKRIGMERFDDGQLMPIAVVLERRGFEQDQNRLDPGAHLALQGASQARRAVTWRPPAPWNSKSMTGMGTGWLHPAKRMASRASARISIIAT